MPGIDKGEVLRYLGHRGQRINPALDRLIDKEIAHCLAVAKPRIVYRVVDVSLDPDGAPRLPEANLELPGRAIRRYLDGAGRCVLLAATLGTGIDTEIRMQQRVDMTRSLALDAAATACIESVCDDFQRKIEMTAGGAYLFAGTRYSPGYGDLPLTLQPELIQALDTARKIGLTCTDSMILLPRKSVTALIGLFDRPPGAGVGPGCSGCSLRGRCDFSKCPREPEHNP